MLAAKELPGVPEDDMSTQTETPASCEARTAPPPYPADGKREGALSSAPAPVFDSTTQQPDSCLFASGHLRPEVDIFKHNSSRAILSGPLPSRAYAEHQIGKSIAVGGSSRLRA